MKKSLDTIFCENIKLYRNRAKLSQEKLSFLIDKNINYINLIESGKSLPPIPMIQKIAEALDIEPYKLFIPSEETVIIEFDKEKFTKDAAKAISEQAQKILLSFLDSK